jgi:hypothetical protein
MIPNPRRLNPRVNAARHQRATRRVLWLMGLAGYLGRDAAGLGAEPPPEPVPEEDEPPTAAPPSNAATPAPDEPTAPPRPVPEPPAGPPPPGP